MLSRDPRWQVIGPRLAVALCLAAAALSPSLGRGQDAPPQDAPPPQDALPQNAPPPDAAPEGSGDMAGVRRDLIAAAHEAMSRHRTLLDIEADLAVLTAAEAERRDRLGAERERLGRLLGALQRLALVPPEAMIARAEAPVDAMRSALLLRAAVPAIEARARDLRDDLAALAEIRRTLDERRAAAVAARADLDARIADMGSLVERRTALLSPPSPEAERAAVQANRAPSLRDLLRRLDRPGEAGAAAPVVLALPPPDPAPDRPGPAPTTRPMPPPSVQDGVLLPVSGVIITRYGEGADRFGQRSRGLTLGVYPGAPVVAPLDGNVRFAGRFRGYGQILILEHGDGYHSLIAGVGRIDVRPGQDVLAGEPVAVTDSLQTGHTGAPTLYFELRRNGQPVDPIQGLMAAQR